MHLVTRSSCFSFLGTITLESNPDTRYSKYGFTAVRLTTPIDKYGIDGFISRQDTLYSLDLKLLFSNLASSLDYRAHYQDLGGPAEIHIKAGSELQLSDYRDLGIGTNLELQLGRGKVS